MALTAVSDLVENMHISPGGDAGVADAGIADPEEVGDGTGAGYARNELSAEGDNAHIAVKKLRVAPMPKIEGEKHTFGVWNSLNNMLQPHIRNVIDINLSLQHNHQCLSVQLDGKDRRWEKKFANHASSLNNFVEYQKAVKSSICSRPWC